MVGVSAERGASWQAGSGAIFDLNSDVLRPMYATSADAAGLPIFPGLVRYVEAVVQKKHRARAALHVSNHSARFRRSRAALCGEQRFDVAPADGDARPIEGVVRHHVISRPEVQIILRAMKTYGMMVADNGSPWYVSGAPDPRWSDDNLSTLHNVPSSAFEVVAMGAVHY